MTSSKKNQKLLIVFATVFLNFFAMDWALGPIATEFAGVLHIRLDYYRQRNNRACDSGLLLDLCDPYFIVTASPAGRPALASFESQPMDNAHQTLQFGQKISQLTNPLRFWFRDSDRLQDLLVIEVTVKDHDSLTPDELMEQFHWSLPLINLTTGLLDSGAFASFNATEPSSALLTGSRGSGDRLSLQAWISCRPGRAGPACRVACTPGRPAADGGFACELASGQRVCLPGFVDPGAGCSRRDPCAVGADGLAPCAHGGECSSSGDGPVCRCPDGFVGPRCQTVSRPCEVDRRDCLHGVCVAAKAGTGRLCACDTGYQGDLCDRDIDECRLVSPCQHASTCVNTFGGFECRCQPGFSGRLCQLPPMLLPPPQPKQVASAAPDPAFAGSATMLTVVLLSVIAVLVLAVLLLLLLLLRWRRRAECRGRFAAVFMRRPADGGSGVKPETGNSDSQSCYDSIEELPLHSAGENPYYADGDNFPNAAYAVEAAAPPPPPPPRLSAVQTASSDRGESPPQEDPHGNCYV